MFTGEGDAEFVTQQIATYGQATAFGVLSALTGYGVERIVDSIGELVQQRANN